MAICQTKQWGNDYCPYVQLEVTSTETSTQATINWTVRYVTTAYGGPIYEATSRTHYCKVTVKGAVRYEETLGTINGKTSYTIKSGSFTVNKTSSTQTISFDLIFRWGSISWGSATNSAATSTSANETASGSITVSATANTNRTLTLVKGTGVASFTGGGTYANGFVANTTAKPSTGYHLTTYTGTLHNGSGTGSWNVTNLYEDTTTWTMNANRTVTANAAANVVSVYYNANGGVATSSDYGGLNEYGFVKTTGGANFTQNISYGNSVDPYNASTFGMSKSGYTFSGKWLIAEAQNGTTVVTSAELDQSTDYDSTRYKSFWTPGETTAHKHNLSCYLYAKWTANTYSVKYNANGGSGSMSNSTHTYDTAKNLTTNAFTRTGYTFKEWNTRSDGTGTAYSNGASVKNLTSTNNGTVNLYAIWSVGSYTITINPNGGSYINSAGNRVSTSTYKIVKGTEGYIAISSTSKTSGLTSPTSDTGVASGYYISEPTRAGFTFKGWKRSDNSTIIGTLSFTAGVMYGCSNPYKNLTVTAQWEPNTVRIWNGSSFQQAIPYVYNGSTWKEASPYIYNGTSWKKVGY